MYACIVDITIVNDEVYNEIMRHDVMTDACHTHFMILFAFIIFTQ